MEDTRNVNNLFPIPMKIFIILSRPYLSEIQSDVLHFSIQEMYIGCCQLSLVVSMCNLIYIS